MAYPLLGLSPSLTLPSEAKFTILDSGQGTGTALRRLVDLRPIRQYRLNFTDINCGGVESLTSFFQAPFRIQTPDDGIVSVVLLEDSLEVIQNSPTLFSVTALVEEVLFTN